MSRIIAIAALVAVTMLAMQASPAAAGAVYKCTNADGKTYYAGQPCPESAQSETLRVPRPGADEKATAKEDDGKSLDERIAEAEDPVLKAQLQLRKKQCELARTQLKRYEDAPFLVEKLDDGSERRLSEEETAAEKQRLRGMITKECQ